MENTKSNCNSLYVLVVLLLFVVQLNAQERELIFPVRFADANYLQYFYIQNKFDSALVNCTVGEFTIRNTSNNVRAYFKRIPNVQLNGSNVYVGGQTQLDGMNGQGRDTIIGAQAVTRPFTIPSGTSTITFFRKMSGGASPCGRYKDSSIDRSGNQTAFSLFPRAIYNVGIGHIPDQSEFRLEIALASDSTTLYVFDSVGVNPNPTFKCAFWYGTTPEKMYHERALPNYLAGKTVFIRVVPYRWGPKPLGMQMNRVFGTLSNYAYLYEYQPDATIFRHSVAHTDSLELMYWNVIQHVYDSTIIARGELPNYQVDYRPQKHITEYQAKYRTTYTDPSTNTTYSGRKFYSDLPQFKAAIDKQYESSLPSKKFHSIQISPSILSIGQDISATIQSPKVAPYSIELVSVTGQKSIVFTTGVVESGRALISLSIPTIIAKGTYIVLLRNSSTTEILAHTKILIQE